MNKVWIFLLEKFGGVLVIKLVTGLSAILMAHGVLQKSAAAQWTETTAGILTGALSVWLSNVKHDHTEARVQQALLAPSPEQIAQQEQVGIAQVNILPTPGVGMSATEIVNRPKPQP